jgi:hypothetical protein
MERYWGIGYRTGLSESRNDRTVQEGFDKGFYIGALLSFCQMVASLDDEFEQLLGALVVDPHTVLTDHRDGAEDLQAALEDLYKKVLERTLGTIM